MKSQVLFQLRWFLKECQKTIFSLSKKKIFRKIHYFSKFVCFGGKRYRIPKTWIKIIFVAPCALRLHIRRPQFFIINPRFVQRCQNKTHFYTRKNFTHCRVHLCYRNINSPNIFLSDATLKSGLFSHNCNRQVVKNVSKSFRVSFLTDKNRSVRFQKCGDCLS